METACSSENILLNYRRRKTAFFRALIVRNVENYTPNDTVTSQKDWYLHQYLSDNPKSGIIVFKKSRQIYAIDIFLFLPCNSLFSN